MLLCCQITSELLFQEDKAWGRVLLPSSSCSGLSHRTPARHFSAGLPRPGHITERYRSDAFSFHAYRGACTPLQRLLCLKLLQHTCAVVRQTCGKVLVIQVMKKNRKLSKNKNAKKLKAKTRKTTTVNGRVKVLNSLADLFPSAPSLT